MKFTFPDFSLEVTYLKRTSHFCNFYVSGNWINIRSLLSKSIYLTPVLSDSKCFSIRPHSTCNAKIYGCLPAIGIGVYQGKTLRYVGPHRTIHGVPLLRPVQLYIIDKWRRFIHLENAKRHCMQLSCSCSTSFLPSFRPSVRTNDSVYAC